MPAPAYLSGKYALITFGAVAQQMDNWKLTEVAEFVDCTNFLTLGHEDGVDGIENGKFSTSGPYKGSGEPSKGSIVTVEFGHSASIKASRRCYVEEVELGTDVKGKGTISVTGRILPIYT